MTITAAIILASTFLVGQTPAPKTDAPKESTKPRAAALSAPPVKPPEPLPKGEKVAAVKLEPALKALTPEENRKSMLMSYPNLVTGSADKPVRIVKEPAYLGNPLYATITLGTGPKAALDVVLDETVAEARIYLDTNRNGDLTDDPKFTWDQTSESKDPETGKPRVSLSGLFVLPAYWGETKGEYALTIMHSKGTEKFSIIRNSARSGKITLGGMSYSVLLAENASMALYDNVAAAKARKPGVWLLIDMNNDGTFKPTEAGREVHDTIKPIPIGDDYYAAEFTPDGLNLSLYKTDAPPKVVESPRNPLLKIGQKAPDFKFILAGGKEAKFSDYQGKIRIVDMWATWCGPCLAAMPKVESLYQQVKDQSVVVLGLDVMDEREAYDKWIEKNAGKKFNFTFGTDPAGFGHKSGGISAAWGVYAIPTTFLIDKDDTILLVLTGFTPEGHAKIVQLLNERGVKVKVENSESISTLE